MEFQCPRFEQDDAVLVLLSFLVRKGTLVTRLFSLLSKDAGEELLHALLVALRLRFLASLQVSVAMRTFQQHAKVGDGANIVFTYIDDKAGIRLLLNSDFATLFLWSDLDTWLRNLDIFLVQVRCNFYRCIAFLNRCDRSCNGILNVLVEVVDFLRRGILVNNDARAIMSNM